MADKETTSAEETEITVDEYKGLPGRTRQEAIHYTCSGCGRLFGAGVYTAINVVSDPELGEELSKGDLNTLACPNCEASCIPNVPLLYHDPKALTFALLLPETLRHLELGERARVLQSLLDDPSDIPDYVRRVEVVFGTSGLLDLLDQTMNALTPQETDAERARIQEAQEERRAEQEAKEEDLLAREEDLQAKQEDMIGVKVKLEQAQEELAQGWRELDREREAVRALSLELQAREDQAQQKQKQEQEQQKRKQKQQEKQQGSEITAVLVDEKPDAEDEVDESEALEDSGKPVELEGRPEVEVNAWRASDEVSCALRHEGKIFLLAKPGAELLKAFTAADPELLVQLINGDNGPILTLVAVAAEDSGKGAADRALYWLFNPSAGDDRALLDALAEEFVLHLDLYDEESRPVTSWEVQAPLSENARHLLERIDAMDDAVTWSYDKAVADYEELGDARLGRKQHNFSSDSFRELPSPAAARLALGIVAYWSEEENEAFLLQVKSFPLTYWKRIRERVVRRAMEFGLHLSPALTAFALEQKLASNRHDLLRSCVSSFSDVSMRIKPSDLDPAQELENWKLLLADCVEEGVRVDLEVEELAAAAAKRAGVEVDETAPGGDLSLLSDEELLQLIADRSHSRDVALELCERGDVKHIEQIYRAICNMTRAEVARVIPAMMQLGPKTLPFFIKGLKHRKSFVRQGCALALGSMKGEGGITNLMEMLLGEPTNVWKEASRALGDMGNLALGALVVGVRSADGEGRERIAWALSQAALNEVCLSEVEAMAKGRDTKLARVATRAMQLSNQVRSFDQEVRGTRPLQDQTIVRSFSRQFFDSMGGEVSELDEEDILEQEEVLDDLDILDEEVEVTDEDIL
jgi:CpXC protein